MTVRRRLAVVITAAAAGGLLAAVPAHAATGTPGADGAGDRYFPLQGNGGYDVAHYDLRLTWNTSDVLGGVARIRAHATQDLSRFDLDLKPNMTVSSVQVNGAPAAFDQSPTSVQELVITPAADLPDGAPFTVEIHYRGVAQNTTDPDGSLDGWIRTDDGVFVASEPQGSPTWFPVNDTPDDKATYAITMTVPTGLAAISNGELVARRETRSTSTWAWRLDQPVSSYLITATIGRFGIRTGHTAGGVPYLIAVDPRERAAVPVLRKLSAMIDFLTRKYGRYPFGQAGAIVDHAPDVGYALETATRPLFDRAPSESTLVHELAHQWYGDGVTLARWRDIWINEGFAEFSSWLWVGAHRRADDRAAPRRPAVDPGVEHRRVEAAAGQPGRGRRDLRGLGVRPRGRHPGRVAREGRRRHLLRDHARLVRQARLRQRHRQAVHGLCVVGRRSGSDGVLPHLAVRPAEAARLAGTGVQRRSITRRATAGGRRSPGCGRSCRSRRDSS